MLRIVARVVAVPFFIVGILLVAYSTLVGCTNTVVATSERGMFWFLTFGMLPTSLGEIITGIFGMLLIVAGYGIWKAAPQRSYEESE